MPIERERDLTYSGFRGTRAALPAESYEQAKVLAPLFNTLVDKISRDGPWLKEVLKDVLVSLWRGSIG